MASASSRITSLKPLLNIVLVLAKLRIGPRTIPIPLSSDAFNCKDITHTNTLPLVTLYTNSSSSSHHVALRVPLCQWNHYYLVSDAVTTGQWLSYLAIFLNAINKLWEGTDDMATLTCLWHKSLATDCASVPSWFLHSHYVSLPTRYIARFQLGAL